MTDYTIKEIEEAVDALTEAEEDYEDEQPWDLIGYGDTFTFTLRGEEVTTVPVERFGGSGQGEDIWAVFRLGDQLFKKTGYYTSHEGAYWEDGDLKEVHAVDRITRYYE